MNLISLFKLIFIKQWTLAVGLEAEILRCRKWSQVYSERWCEQRPEEGGRSAARRGANPARGSSRCARRPGPGPSAWPARAQLNPWGPGWTRRPACGVPWGCTINPPLLFLKQFCQFLFLNINRHWQKHLKYHKIWIYIDLERPFKIIYSNLFTLRQDLRSCEITDAPRPPSWDPAQPPPVRPSF